MANRNAPFSFRFLRMDHGVAAPAAISVLLGSNVGVKPGDPIYIDTNGVGQRCTVTNPIWAFADETIVAVAATRQSAHCLPALEDAVWLVQATGTTNVTQAFYGKFIRYDAGTSGIAGVAASTTGTQAEVATLAPFRIVGFHRTPDNAISTYALLEVKVARSQYAGHADVV